MFSESSRVTVRFILSVAVIGVSFVATSSASAQPVIYASKNTPPTLYSINLATGQATLAKNGLPETQVAVARHPHSNDVYMLGNVGNNPIVTWNPDSDTVAYVTETGFGTQYHRLGFNSCDELYGVGLNSRTLFRVDPVTGTKTNLGAISGTPTGGATGDLAFPVGECDCFYYAVGISLYTVNVATLNPTFIGNAALNGSIEGLSVSHDDRLYCITDKSLYELDPTDASSTFIGNYNVGKLNDAASGHDTLVVDVKPINPDVGDTITYKAFKGLSSGLLAVVLTSAGGTPIFHILFLASFDANGEYSFSGTIPASFTGAQITFNALGQNTAGEIILTNGKLMVVN
jgi:hypothetical protein